MEQTNETAQHISTEAEKALKVEFSFLNKLQLTLEVRFVLLFKFLARNLIFKLFLTFLNTF